MRFQRCPICFSSASCSADVAPFHPNRSPKRLTRFANDHDVHDSVPLAPYAVSGRPESSDDRSAEYQEGEGCSGSEFLRHQANRYRSEVRHLVSMLLIRSFFLVGVKRDD